MYFCRLLFCRGKETLMLFYHSKLSSFSMGYYILLTFMMSDILFIPLLAPPQLQNNFIMIILYSNVDCGGQYRTIKFILHCLLLDLMIWRQYLYEIKMKDCGWYPTTILLHNRLIVILSCCGYYSTYSKLKKKLGAETRQPIFCLLMLFARSKYWVTEP